MADKKRKRQKDVYEVFTEIDNRNRTGLGWNPEDFGIYQLTNVATGVGTNAIQFKPGTTSGAVVSGSAPTAVNDPAKTIGRFGTNVIPATTPASSFLSPQEQAQVQRFAKDPRQVAVGSGPIDGAKTFLANLFDTSDTFDPTRSATPGYGSFFGYEQTNLPETVWDGFLGSLQWGYDRLTQLTVAGLSGLPGGTKTLSWDEAGDVSVGQMFVAGVGESVGRIRRGEGTAGDIFAAVATPLNIAGTVGAMQYPDSPIQQAGFDITSEQDRKAFEEGPEKFFSGVTDFGFVFADPLIFGSKAAKLARLKWIDRPMDTPEARAILKQELDLGATSVAAGTAGTEPLSPAAEFVRWSTEKTDDGLKVRSEQEIYNHPLVKGATYREQVASALYHADDYETGALILRYMKGDVEAGAALVEKRADLADAIARQQREYLMTVAASNPDKVKAVERLAQMAANSAIDRLDSLRKAGLEGTDEWNRALRFNDNAQQTYVDIANGNFDLVRMSTPEGVDISRKIFKSLVASDQALAKARGDELLAISGIAGAMSKTAGTRGIPSNTAFGRAVERSRQRRATAAYQSAATRGRLVETGRTIVREDGSTAVELKSAGRTPFSRTYWQKDEFGIGGFRRGVRMWRWLGEENPAGYIATKGLAAQESGREARAVLNDVEIYSGSARTITLSDGTVVQVGGLQRKEQLLQMYVDAVNDTTQGADRAQKALFRLEEAMLNDILSWHGVRKSDAEIIKRKARQVRDDTVASLKDPQRNFFVDDDGNFDHIPWLEQHLQNGTYMLNYRALEKAARLYDEQGLALALDKTGDYISQNFMRIYGVFNDFWRPSVLLRLGYTMRNVVEGQFRAAAFTSSIDPLRYGVENGIYSLRNTAVSFAGKKAIRTAENNARLRAAGNASVPMPKKYQKWLGAQITAREAETNRIDGLIRNWGNSLARMSPVYRDRVVAHLEEVQNNAVDAMARARAAGASADEIAARQADIDDAFKQLNELSKIKTFTGINDASEAAFENLTAHVKMYNSSVALRNALDDESIAVALYAQQGNAKRRIFSKPVPSADGSIIAQAAFSEDSPFTPVALSLLSSDATQQSMLQLSMNLGNNVFRAIRQQSYQNVKPGMPRYYDGYASVLRDIKLSQVGSRMLAGETDDQIVDFLMSPGEGRDIMSFLMGGKRFNRDDAIEKVSDARDKYEYLVKDERLREFLRVTTPDENLNGDAIRTIMEGRIPQDQLPNVIGNIAEDFGSKNIMDTWRSATSFLMKLLGTLPEDTLIRQPFYGVRWNNVFTEMLDDLRSQTGEIVSMSQLTELYRLAHARALKDTKDYLYTIERRTNLGTYGEVMIPFVSAAQNSVTTVGRLIWNDPTTAVIAIDAWRAPAAAGFEDENGNIVIPIPKDLIPDAIEKALGFDAMENWKIKKGALNVIVPESGFAFVPRPGPIVAAPASEFMKHGMFGVSVESPDLLRQFFGKEGADQVWTVWKNYLFGEGQGVAPDQLSLSMLTPPQAQKMIQLIQGTDNAQFGYYYNLIYRTEMLNWMGGFRDDMPDKDEVMGKTRGLTIARWIANVAAFTPPQYESKIDPLIQAIREIQSKYPEDADRMIYQQYGPYLQMIGDFSNSKNYAGMGPYANSVEIARKHADLINQVSPSLERLGDLSVLSMLTMGATSSSLYDDSAYGWQFANNIPGVNVNFRATQTPEQSWAQSRVNTGWTVYIAKMDELEARLKQSGATSFRQNPELKAERDQFLAGMAENPLFKEWWEDYKEFGSSRTLAAISTMEAALVNESFMAEYGNTSIWTKAREYLYHRSVVTSELAKPERAGTSIDNNDNQDVRDYWDQARSYLSQDPEWAAFSNRFLNGDDNPQQPGVQVATYYETGGE